MSVYIKEYHCPIIWHPDGRISRGEPSLLPPNQYARARKRAEAEAAEAEFERRVKNDIARMKGEGR